MLLPPLVTCEPLATLVYFEGIICNKHELNHNCTQELIGALEVVPGVSAHSPVLLNCTPCVILGLNPSNYSKLSWIIQILLI